MPADTRTPLIFKSRSPGDTQLLGRRLGELARPGDVILLVGQLGAGKTCLVQGLAVGLGVRGYVPSPSFVLLREYKGRLPLYHMDLYRLEDLAEIADLGLDDYFYGEGVSVVEWADRAMELLPPEHLFVDIRLVSDRQRRIELVPSGRRYLGLVSAVERLLGARLQQVERG